MSTLLNWFKLVFGPLGQSNVYSISSRKARMESNVPKLKGIQELTVLKYILWLNFKTLEQLFWAYFTLITLRRLKLAQNYFKVCSLTNLYILHINTKKSNFHKIKKFSLSQIKWNVKKHLGCFWVFTPTSFIKSHFR